MGHPAGEPPHRLHPLRLGQPAFELDAARDVGLHRDEAGEGHEIDVYVARHSKARFSHGLCEPCLRALYPEVADDILDTLRTS